MKQVLINGTKLKLTLQDDWSCLVESQNGSRVLLTESNCGLQFRQQDFIKTVRHGRKTRSQGIPLTHQKAIYYKAFIEALVKMSEVKAKESSTLTVSGWSVYYYDEGRRIFIEKGLSRLVALKLHNEARQGGLKVVMSNLL